MHHRFWKVLIAITIIVFVTGSAVIPGKSFAPFPGSFSHTRGMEIGHLDTDNDQEIHRLFMDTWGFTMDESLPICGIKEYMTDGDNDLSWSCEITQANGGWNFELREAYDGNDNSSGFVSANALVLDTNYFELIDGAEFWIYSDYIQVHRFWRDHTWKKFAPDQREIFDIPAGAIPLVTINTYDSNGDDDFSFTTSFDWNAGALVMDGVNGNDGSYAYGNIYILRGRSHPEFGSDYTGKIEENGWFFTGNYTSNFGEPVDFYFADGFWDEANTYTFNSIFALWSNDKDYQISTSSRVNSDGVTTYAWRDLGDSDSQVGIETAVLQTYPLD